MLAPVPAGGSPRCLVKAGVRDGILEIFPDPMAQQMAGLRLADPKAFEQAFLDLAAAQ